MNWLMKNDYSSTPVVGDSDAHVEWCEWISHMDFEEAKFQLEDVENSNATRAILEYLLKYGIVILRTGNGTAENFEMLCDKLAGFVDRSYFGNFFDLNPKRDDATDSISFSTKALPLHTDIPYYGTPPDFQFLYGLRIIKVSELTNAGRTKFVDGLAVANAFRESSPDDFDILRRTRVTYRAAYPWAGKIYQNCTEMIQVDDGGRVCRLLNNPSKMFFEGVAYETMFALYCAYRNFKIALEQAQLKYEHDWEQGDMVVFDNRRIFHGRDEFGQREVTRTLRGGYFREVELMARLRYLRDRRATQSM